ASRPPPPARATGSSPAGAGSCRSATPPSSATCRRWRSTGPSSTRSRRPRARATTWWPATAASSPSATPASRARWAARSSTRPSPAWSASPTATSWSARTAGSSTSPPGPSSARWEETRRLTRSYLWRPWAEREAEVMDFSWSEEDELLRETVRRYATERLAPDYSRWEREPFPRERVKELGDLGVLGMLIPEEYGGSGGPGPGGGPRKQYVSFGIAAEEIGRADFNVTSYLQLAGITAGLLAQGSDDIRKEWLPGVATGDLVMAFALTEPGVGSDAARLSVTARRDGGDLVVSGEKASCTFAGSADGCVVFARTGGPG